MNDVSVLAMSTAYSILDTIQTWQQGQTEKQKDDRTDDESVYTSQPVLCWSPFACSAMSMRINLCGLPFHFGK